MSSVLPAIIAKDFDEVRRKSAMTGASLVQLDVIDGIFSPQKSWPYLPELLDDLSKVEDLAVPAEVHLMVNNPEEIAGEWAAHDKVARVIFHFEATTDPRTVIADVRSQGKEVGIALKFETPVEVVREYASDIDTLLLMSIAQIGTHGIPFEQGIFEKLREAKEMHQELLIGVDGGVNEGNAQALLEDGADYLIVGSGIFHAADPAGAYKQFLSLV